MIPASVRWPLLALALAGCSQAEPPVPQFETVTLDYREPSARLASVPLPARKPAATTVLASHEVTAAHAVANEPGATTIGELPAAAPQEQTVAAAATESHGAKVSRILRRLLPDFNQITACPSSSICQAFTN